MKIPLTILTFVLASSFVASEQTLPAKVNTFLKQNYPGWEISKFRKLEYQENKSIATGDFNGDGKTDYAVVINKDERVYTLVLMPQKNSFKAVNLLAQGDGEHWITGISTITKGEKLDVYKDTEFVKSFRVKTDAVYLSDGEGHGRTYYLENGEFLFTHDF